MRLTAEMYSLERLGLEAVSRRFLERVGLVSVLKVERLALGSRVS